MDDTRSRVYRFASFRLDTRSRELREGGGPAIPLTSRAFDTLCVLLDNRDRVMSKDDLLAAVWPGRIVEENNLSQAISALRRALGTDVGDHRYIVTMPGRGYRFVADVVEGDDEQFDDSSQTGTHTPPLAEATAPRRRVDRRRATDAPPRAVILGAVLFMLALFAIIAWRLRESPDPMPASATATAAPVTLAVLPFRSLSPGPPDELLELGLAETLVTRLGRSQGLRVRSLASAQRLTTGQVDPIDVGRELAASYVVAGSTQRVGEDVRVNVHLLSVDGGGTVLSQTFDAHIDQVFTLQDAIGDAVTTALELQPVAVSARAAAPCEANSADAFRALLRAQYMLHRRAPETIAAYREAIALDPSCSRAYAGLATSYLFLAHNDAPPDEVFPLAKGAALQALKIDPDSAEAHMAYGRYLQLHDWNWRGAEEALRRAIDRNPSLADAHFSLAHLLVATGRFDEGLDQARQARELDPLSPFINALGGGFFSAAGQSDEARAWVARSLELEPDFWIALLVRGGLALDRGDAEAAVADLQRAAERSHRASQVLAMLAVAEVAAGRRPHAEAILRELQQRAAAGYLQPTSLAAVYNALGDTDAALGQLERAYAGHDIRTGFLKVDARWNNLRGQPRFETLMRKLGLPEAPAHGRY